MATPRRRLTFGAGRLAPVSTAVTKVDRISIQALTRMGPEDSRSLPTDTTTVPGDNDQDEDTEMTDSVQTRVSRLDQEIQNLIDCCNSEKEVIEVEFDDVRRDCEIFAQQVETNRIMRSSSSGGTRPANTGT